MQKNNTMEIYISLIGATVAIIVSVIGAILANKNNITLQTRKLKEEHYIAYIEALHNLASNNDELTVKEYTFQRDKLFLIASEDVIRKMIIYENEGINKTSDIHDKYLTELLKAIRADLKLKNTNLPTIFFKK